MQSEIKKQIHQAMLELLEVANLKENDLFVIGCSTSEVTGHKIGTESAIEVASELFDEIYPMLKKRGIYLAAQCCEHLNRAIIMEEEARKLYQYEAVNAVPVSKAGGSFATIAYERMTNAVAVEEIKAAAGMDIGDTLIGMHLKRVAIPVRLSVKKIGEANLVCARTRAKFIGGERARYNSNLM